MRGLWISDLSIRICNDQDLDLLAELNQQLIDDEEYDKKFTLEELKERMSSFIKTDYQAYLFEKGEKTIGYALVNHKSEPLYVRHFFICREVRRQGYGTLAFNSLLSMLKVKTLNLEVMFWNERGIQFWQSLGFKERCIYMRFDKP